MRALEHKIPPPVVAVLIMVATGFAAAWGPKLDLPRSVRIGVLVFLLACGVALALAGSQRFKLAQTTVNPLKPDRATALVTTGIYRFTRNPMYLGLAIALAGWAAFLCSPWGLLGPVAFLLYMNRFQIAPEERVLLAKFGGEYEAYMSRVRRWW